MEIGITEGAIVLILKPGRLKHYKAHFDLYRKIDSHFFFMEFALFEE